MKTLIGAAEPEPEPAPVYATGGIVASNVLLMFGNGDRECYFDAAVGTFGTRWTWTTSTKTTSR